MNRSDVYEAVTNRVIAAIEAGRRGLADALAPQRRQPPRQRAHEEAVPRRQRGGALGRGRVHATTAPAFGPRTNNGRSSRPRSERASARASSSSGRNSSERSRTRRRASGSARKPSSPAHHGCSTPTRSTAGRHRPRRSGTSSRRSTRPRRSRPQPAPTYATAASAHTTGARPTTSKCRTASASPAPRRAPRPKRTTPRSCTSSPIMPWLGLCRMAEASADLTLLRPCGSSA